MCASRPYLWCVHLLAVTLLVIIAATPRAARADSTLRIAVLKFGTVSWVMDVIEHHELDETYGIDIDKVELASNQATLVALQAGRVARWRRRTESRLELNQKVPCRK